MIAPRHMLLLVLLAWPLGCEAPELPAAATGTVPPAPVAAAPAEPAPTMVAGIEGPPLPEDETPVTDVPRKFTAKDPIKGRRTREIGGVAGNFGAALWAKHQAIIQAIDQANQLYWPQHDFSYPKSHEEFMKEVVALALNGVPMPEIPADEELIYVPEQGEVGLQIRLIPGSPRSKLPKPEPGKEHVLDLAALAAAGIQVPGPDGEAPANQAPAAEAVADPAAAAAEPAAEEPVAEEPSPNIRTRAEQYGEQGNARLEERAVAPGGLAPAGGLGEGGL